MDTIEERSCAILAHLTNQSFVSNKRTLAKTWVLLVPSQGLVLSVRTYNLSSHRSLSYTGETMIDYWLPLRMLSWLVPIWIPPLHVTRRVRARLADVLYQTQTIGDSDQVPSSHNLSFALLCATVNFGTLSFARLSSSSVAFVLSFTPVQHRTLWIQIPGIYPVLWQTDIYRSEFDRLKTWKKLQVRWFYKTLPNWGQNETDRASVETSKNVS